MSQKIIETKKYKSNSKKASNEIDVNEKGIVHIDNVPYLINGVVAKFILSLLEELDIYESQLKFLESFMGEHGKS